ncbi:MAG: redoxin domain-containing protein [Phenylobacterium sp.]|uniref:redoxin domain-containing protein n=1 Tax=Phenylobacterium sp. TaxID=1871053 RepID=UPI001A52506F|nr:redoxin domain-containing protein [Phenylobacterium sp.]MBL8769836.1 redoxin domain-containing protein [Phenylobacterium sp.]
MIHARLGLAALLASTAVISSCATDQSTTAALTGSAVGASVTTPATVDNFMLVDANLEAHELYRLADAPAVVIVTQANGDAVLRGEASALNAMAKAYGAKGVEFRMLNSSLKDSRESVRAEAEKVGYALPILMDNNQLIGESLGVTRSAEAYVINPKTWTVVYRGPVQGAQAALDAFLAGKPGPAATMASNGALIAFPERGADHAKLTYVKDVAPIIEKNCMACHQEGGIGPMQLTSYEMVKGFSPMIREVIRTDRMPPYNADPHVGKFSDTKNLTPAEIKTLVHWVEAGAPRGEGADPLAGKKHVAAEWPLGKPDLILNIPEYKIPASGVVDYQRPFTLNPMTEGKWIRATTVKPGDRQAVHHVLTGWMKEAPANGVASETRWRGSVGGYAVGAESNVFGGDVGTFLPAGGAVGFQMHYTPYGKETVDRTQIGVYFRDTAPKYMMRSVVVIDGTIEIQPNAPRHKETAYVEFPNDALLYSAFPHAHYRAYSSDLWLQTPDGKKTLLLSLPRYDFNWQRSYTFAEPIKIPAGSKLIANYVYDNSKRNPANPDPSIKVTWGEQSHEEMLFTSVSFRWLDETAAKQVDSDARFAQTRMIGMMDDNLDGKIQKAEARGTMGRMIARYFPMIDKDGDGALDRAELAAAQSMLPQRRRGQQADGPNENTPLS